MRVGTEPAFARPAGRLRQPGRVIVGPGKAPHFGGVGETGLDECRRQRFQIPPPETATSGPTGRGGALSKNRTRAGSGGALLQ